MGIFQPIRSLFVYLWFFEFFDSLIWKHTHCRGRVAHFYLYSTLDYAHVAVRVLKHSTPTVTQDNHYIIYGHLRGPMTFTPVAGHLAVELSLLG